MMRSMLRFALLPILVFALLPLDVSAQERSNAATIREACRSDYDLVVNQIWDTTPVDQRRGMPRSAFQNDMWKRALEQIETTVMRARREDREELLAAQKQGVRGILTDDSPEVKQWMMCTISARLAQLDGTLDMPASTAGASISGITSTPNSPERVAECAISAKRQGLSGSALSRFASDCKGVGSSKTTGLTSPYVGCVKAMSTKGTSILNRDETTFYNRCPNAMDVYWCDKAICRTTSEFKHLRLNAKANTSISGNMSRYAQCTTDASFELRRTLLGEAKFQCIKNSFQAGSQNAGNTGSTGENLTGGGLASGSGRSGGSAGSGKKKGPPVHNPAMIAMKCVAKIYEPPGKYDRTGSWHFQNNCGRAVRVFWCTSQKACDTDNSSTTNLAKDETTKYGAQVVQWGACYGTAMDGRGFIRGTRSTRLQCFDD